MISGRTEMPGGVVTPPSVDRRSRPASEQLACAESAECDDCGVCQASPRVWPRRERALRVWRAWRERRACCCTWRSAS